MNKRINKQRRQLLVWTAPTVAVIALPAHAQMSPCTGPPVVSVAAAPKCAGDPPIGSAQLEILAPDAMPMELISVEVTTDDPASTLNDLPSLPAMLSDSTPMTVTWDGPASDAVTCLPLAQISMALEYACSDGVIVVETYDITDLLIASVA